MEANWLILMQEQSQLQALIAANQHSQKFGLTLTEAQAKTILQERRQTLQEQQRVEFGASITEKIIYTFCSSPYLNQNNYAEAISRLQEIFFLYKNEMQDEITDDELLQLMKEQFEKMCFGDLDYLANTCLYNFAQAIRAGYRSNNANQAGEYAKFDEVQRWDYQLYLEALQDIAWR